MNQAAAEAATTPNMPTPTIIKAIPIAPGSGDRVTVTAAGGAEEHLEHHAPPVRMPRPVADPVGQRRLNEG